MKFLRATVDPHATSEPDVLKNTWECVCGEKYIEKQTTNRRREHDANYRRKTVSAKERQYKEFLRGIQEAKWVPGLKRRAYPKLW